MGTGNGRGERVSVPERSGGTSTESPRPDPEVPDKAKRRHFSAQYKLRVLEEADACREPGAISALLRREGLFSSHLAEWRRARREGSLKALAKARGPKGRRRDPVTAENEQLRKENGPSAATSGAGADDPRGPKKSLRAPGDPPEPAAQRRRRMRTTAEQLAPAVGLTAACRALGVARASVYRHRQPPVSAPCRPHRHSPRALAPQERAQVMDTLHEDRFVDRAPAAVYATLLEEGRYLCSIRTMYRVLHSAGEVLERRRQRRHPHRTHHSWWPRPPTKFGPGISHAWLGRASG